MRGPRLLLAIGVAAALVLPCSLAGAQSPTLEVSGRQASRTYTQRELLADPAIRDVTLPDPVYRRTMTYRAIPMPELLKATAMGGDDYVQARAIDNFSVSIPGTYFAAVRAAQAEAFLAIEDPAAPWPPIRARQTRASPTRAVQVPSTSSGAWRRRPMSARNSGPTAWPRSPSPTVRPGAGPSSRSAPTSPPAVRSAPA